MPFRCRLYVISITLVFNFALLCDADEHENVTVFIKPFKITSCFVENVALLFYYGCMPYNMHTIKREKVAHVVNT